MGAGTVQTATHVGYGDASAGSTKLRYSQALTIPLVINQLESPTFAIGALVATED
jgi:hypothetical protein